MSALCRVGLHRWQAMTHGGNVGLLLDARRCLRCGRFDVWAYGRFHEANRGMYQDAHDVPALSDGSQP